MLYRLCLAHHNLLFQLRHLKYLHSQYDIWADPDKVEKRERLDAAVEAIRGRFGKDSIRNAVLLMPMKLPEKRSVEIVMPSGMVC